MVLKMLFVSTSQVNFYKYLQEKKERKEEGGGEGVFQGMCTIRNVWSEGVLKAVFITAGRWKRKSCRAFKAKNHSNEPHLDNRKL